MSAYREFFRSLTGHDPFPWQERLQSLMSNRQSAILRVPTGAGKTWGAVAPFLHGIKTEHRLADRLLYALPLQSLASSLHATVYDKTSAAFGQSFDSGKDRDYKSPAIHCSLQFGGQKNDPFFESDLVFTTIDQLLSSYVFIPVSLPARLANINGGALIGSLLIFDELHMLDPDVALRTTIEMLDRLNGLCQFVLMTATMSDVAMRFLADKLKAYVIEVPEAEIRALPSQRTKRRTWRYSDQPISAQPVRESHQGGRTIVLFNSVSRAQQLFQELQTAYAGKCDAPELALLHARYYPEDRKPVEDRLAAWFGPQAIYSNVILVTTQVVEAGMDLSADHLHTEIAPMSALIQRAGRTARYEHRCVGDVTVYEAQSLGPYRAQQTVIEATRTALLTLPPGGEAVDFLAENEWIHAVHQSQEVSNLRLMSLHSRRGQVHKAMDTGERGLLSELVRNVNSVAVLISSNPEGISFSKEGWPRLLPVSAPSLLSLSGSYSTCADGAWVAKGATELADDPPGVRFRWDVLTPGQLRAQWMLAIHPDFASYDPQLGLVLNRKADEPVLRYSERAPVTRYQYSFETWAEHAERIRSQCREMQTASGNAARLLALRYAVPVSLIEILAEVVCVLHDAGKLTIQWQEPAWRRQNDKDLRMRARGLNVEPRPRVPIAHTWYDPDADYEWQRETRYNLPPHAVEGAYAVADGITDFLCCLMNDHDGAEIAKSLYSAIARHHGPRSSALTLFQLVPQAAEIISRSLPTDWRGVAFAHCQLREELEYFKDDLLRFGGAGEQAWALYSFLVRRLRLADQAAVRPQK